MAVNSAYWTTVVRQGEVTGDNTTIAVFKVSFNQDAYLIPKNTSLPIVKVSDLLGRDQVTGYPEITGKAQGSFYIDKVLLTLFVEVFIYPTKLERLATERPVITHRAQPMVPLLVRLLQARMRLLQVPLLVRRLLIVPNKAALTRLVIPTQLRVISDHLTI